jgi:large subunit ribosomal protein L22
MEASVARVRDYVRRQVGGLRVWRVGVEVPKDGACKVKLHTPDKPDRFVVERDKGRDSIVACLEQGLSDRYGREFTVEVVQAPVAVVKYVRISPRKCRFVVDAIRGKTVADALAILQFVPNSAAKTVAKLVKSAAANAENNHRMDPDKLEVMHVHVDEGPTLKRISPRAMGRAYRIMKRTSHIIVGLAEGEQESKIGRRGKAIAKTAAKAPKRTAKAEAAKPKAKRAPKKETAPAANEAVTASAPEAEKPEGGE